MADTTARRSLVLLQLLAGACSFLLLAATIVLLLRWQMPHARGIVLTLAGCFGLSALFGFIRPAGGLQLGLWASAAFWIYFGGVAMALLFNDQFDWIPLLEAIAAITVGCVGVLSGARVRNFAASKA